MAVCGFDLGTQNLLVAVAQKRGIDVLANEASNRQTPAVVSFGEGERCIGESGAVKKMRNLRNSVWNVKRLLGKSWSDEDARAEREQLSCKFVEQETSCGADIGVQVEQGGERQVFSPTQLAAMLLSRMSDVVEQETKVRPGFSVVAVPGFFTERERQEALNAAEIANIRPIGLITETAAIALGYGIYKEWPKAEADAALVAFVDFGASSLSVSIVSFCAEGLRVLSTAYDRQLGGRDFDRALFEHVRQKISEKHRIDVAEQARTAARLLAACEGAKKTLSTCPDATIFLENLEEDVDFTLPVTRDNFEDICAALFARLEEPIQAAIAGATQRRQHLFPQSAPIQHSDITSVEVTGGSWRIPKVTRLLQEHFGRDVSKTINSEEAVVRGAAVRCAQLCPVFRTKDFKVRDASPYAIEFSMLEDPSAGYRTLFPRNQSIPCTMQLSYTRADPLNLSFRYTSDAGTPKGSPSALYAFSIPSIPASEVPGQLPKVLIKAGLDRSGFVVCNAYADVPVQAPPAAASSEPVKDDDKPAAEKKAVSDDAPAPAAETAPAPAAEAATSAEPAFKVKRVTLDCHTEPLGTSKAQLEAWVGLEQKLRAADRLFLETAEARNNLESYILALRSKLSNIFREFSTEEEKEVLRPLLDSSEDWLYDEGCDATKQVYDAKISALKAKGEPIAKRHFEHEERPVAVSDLRLTINNWRNQAQTTEEKYAHVSSEDRERIAEHCSSAENWLNEQLAAVGKLPLSSDPSLLVVDIRQRNTNLAAACAPIMNKPKPAPPKVETPAPAPAPAAADAPAGAPAATDDDPAPASTEAAPVSDDPPVTAPLTDDIMD